MIQFQRQKKTLAADRNGMIPTAKFMSPWQSSWVSHHTYTFSYHKTDLG